MSARGASMTLFERQGYGVGGATYALANTAILFFLAKFLVDEVGLAPGIAGAVIFVGKAWDAVTDPVVGRLTDRTRAAMGGRRIWTAGAFVPFALLFAALWVPWPLEGWSLVVCTALLLMAYNTAFTCYVVPYGALSAVLTDDYDERTSLNAARMGWTLVAGLVGAIVMPLVRESTGTYTAGAAIVAVVMLPPAMLMLFATRGKDAPHTSATSTEPLWTVLRVPAFQRVALLFLAAWSSISVLAALLPFYVRDHLGDPKLEDAVMGTVQLAGLLTIPLAMYAAKRLEKHRAYTVLIGSWAVLLVGLAALPEGSWGWGLFMCALMGPGVAGAHVLPWSMLPDVVEADQVANGTDRAGAFYGAMTFLEKAASAVALQAMLLGLDLSGYDRALDVQGDTTQLAILLMIGPIPGVILLLAAAFAWFRPPMTRAEHAAAVAALESTDGAS